MSNRPSVRARHRDPIEHAALAADRGLRLRMRTEEQRIAGQHERLDDLCREVYDQLDKAGPAAATNDCLLFLTALDAHMKVEEEVYFPALHGLSPQIAGALTRLVDEHTEIRTAAEATKQALKAAVRGEADRDAARAALRALGRRVADHEEAEEDLLARVSEGPVARGGHSAL